MISVGGIGAFIGAIYAGKISNRLGIRRALLFTLVAGQLTVLLIPASLINPEYGVWFLVASQFFEDAFITIFFILALSLRQELIPGEILGRANATFHVFSNSLFLIGALIAGPLTVWIGFEATLWVAALGALSPIP
ncbi:MAG: MFS transporter [Paracoccaceae bacterium]